MRSHTEQFIESNTENSWIKYLKSMSRQGTWAYVLGIHSTADSLLVRIYITESHSNFANTTIINAVTCQIETNLFIGHVNEFRYVSAVLEVPNTEQMFRDSSLNAKAFDDYVTGKTARAHSREVRKQQTCAISLENSNTYLQHLTRQGGNGVKNVCSIETSQSSSNEDAIQKKLRQAAGKEYDNKRKTNESDESREARLLAKHMKYEENKLGSAQSLTRHYVNEEAITSKQNHTNEQGDITLMIYGEEITIAKHSDNLEPQNVENVWQVELTKKKKNMYNILFERINEEKE